MQIVINTFYKCLRAEGRMLKINLLNILLFFIFLGFFSFFFFSVTIVVCAIFFSVLFVVYFSEIYLRRILNIQEKKDFIGEMLLLSVFIITAYWNTWIGIVIYLLLCVVYVLSHYKTIYSIIK